MSDVTDPSGVVYDESLLGLNGQLQYNGAAWMLEAIIGGY